MLDIINQFSPPLLIILFLSITPKYLSRKLNFIISRYNKSFEIKVSHALYLFFIIPKCPFIEFLIIPKCKFWECISAFLCVHFTR